MTTTATPEPRAEGGIAAQPSELVPCTLWELTLYFLRLGTFGFGASPQTGGDVPALQAAIDAEIAEVLKNGVTEAELATAKTLLAADAIKARDSLSNPARTIGAALATGGTLEDVEAWPDRIDAVTVEQVNAAARYVLRPESSVTSILLPKETS